MKKKIKKPETETPAAKKIKRLKEIDKGISRAKKRINSRSKGKRGELELVHFLAERGIIGRRGQQYEGSSDSPDVVVGGALSGIHLEVKRVESGNLYNWLDQACKDSDVCKTPVVAHKRNGRRWLAILDFRDFLTLLETIQSKK